MSSMVCLNASNQLSNGLKIRELLTVLQSTDSNDLPVDIYLA